MFIFTGLKQKKELYICLFLKFNQMLYAILFPTAFLVQISQLLLLQLSTLLLSHNHYKKKYPEIGAIS